MTDGTEAAGEDAGNTNTLMNEFYALINRDPKFLDFFHNHILDGLWYCDLTQPETPWISPRFWHLLGYSAEQIPFIKHRNWDDHIHPDDYQKAVDSFHKIYSTSENMLFHTLRFRHASGSTIWLNYRTLIVRDHSGLPIRAAGMYYDVTAFKAHEEALIKANRELHYKQQSIAHDLKQPLATAIMLLDALKNTRADFPECNEELIEDALESLNGMNQQIEGILEQAGRHVDLNMQGIHVDKLVERIERDLRAKIERHGAEIRVHDTPVVQGNPILLRILFQNLIANAIKYRRQDASAVIDIRARDRQNYWEFTISDNGIGIDEKYHRAIFNRYARADEVKAREGSGLGLALCREAIARHRGRIWVKSEPGKGSTFFFTLPKKAELAEGLDIVRG